MNKPTDAQIKEFWEWCGFYQDEAREADGEGYSFSMVWMPPFEKICYSSQLPDIDLNNLFKYAVPKLFEKSYGVKIFTDDGFYFGQVIDEHDEVIGASIVGTEDPAIVLFWSIWDVIGHD